MTASTRSFSTDPPEGCPPRAAGETLWRFEPDRDQQGRSAWLLQSREGAVLVDVPALTRANLAALNAHDPGQVVLTHRGGHGRIRRFLEHLDWRVWIQEQEAYLLPDVNTTSFNDLARIGSHLTLHWTPGPTPGSCCLHWQEGTRDVLFCGALLQSGRDGGAAPVRTAHTFHWGRQIRSLERLRLRLGPRQPGEIACSSGSGSRLVANGAGILANLNPDALRALPAGTPITRQGDGSG